MQTMNFQCGHCNNLMAVSTEFLGQQVRCPHCGGVVVAPGAPAPGPDVTRNDPPLFQAPSRSDDHEDIFSQHVDASDDLFGGDAPRLEIPREPEPAPAPAPSPHIPAQTGFNAEMPPAETPATGWHSSPVGATAATPSPAVAPSTMLPSDAPSETTALPTPTRTKAPAKVDWFFPLVFMPLILYAIGMTALAVFLYARLATEQPSLFDRMPDMDGDNPGVARQKVGLEFKKADALAPLPKHLLTKLGEPLTIGDLEVTGLKVERKKIGVHVQGYEEAQDCAHASLVLHLRLKNVGKDYRFTPVDNYFDRQWDGRTRGAPLTVLIAGQNQFFGGPAKWVPLIRDRRKGERREWIAGRKDQDPKGIGPGESMETVVATDGEDKRADAVFTRYQGKLLWRLHLRRGLIVHRGRELPAQCVVGIEFTNKDYGG